MKYCQTCHSTYPTDFSTCPKDQAVLREITEMAPGMVLRGKYRIEEKVGEGGMAAVYRATHMYFKEELAIKVVSAALQGNPDFAERFKREAVITRKLRHPNAVHLDDFDFTEDGRPFIAMEFVRGKSLRRVLQENGHLPVGRAFNIARQVALALGAAHALGIVHRDIKPDNVVLVPQADGSDLVKVLDFGIAKVTGEDSGISAQLTSTGMVLGTPHYLSPEQARGKKSSEIDGRADLYALGVMLYEMVTGELPFKSDTAIEILLQHIQSEPTPTHLLKPEMKIPEEVSALITKALQKDPAQRFQTGETMAQALAQSGELPMTTAGPERTPGGGTVAKFDTAALAAAAGHTPTPVTPPSTAQMQAETRVLGSASFTGQTVTPAVAASAAPTAATAKPAPKKRRKALLWSGGIAALAALLIWGGWALGNRNSEPQPAETLPADNVPQTSTPARSTYRRARPTTQQRYPQATSPVQQSYGQQPGGLQEQQQAAQRARAQELVAQGNRRLAARDFGGASSDFQQALSLDPNNSAAQNGLKIAQSGAIAQGIGSIFHR
jgi:eukaryotic-like serine/threonine-protein kinase